MKKMRFWTGIAIGAALVALVIGAVGPDSGSFNDSRKKAEKLYHDGNHKDALEIYQKLALDPQNDARLVGSDLGMAVNCLNTLNRYNETDELWEKFAGVHAASWRALMAAAQGYFDANHNGFIIAGKFERGGHRGGGKYVNSIERDRVRALQLMDQARKLAESAAASPSITQNEKGELANFYLQYARILLGYRGYSDAWRLQYLSDLEKLPDYEEGYWRGHGGETRGAPVDADGNPVFHMIPKNFDAAQTDGERWRWMLMQAIELNPGNEYSVKMDFANFLNMQFGEQTMAYYGGYFRQSDDDDTKKDTSGTYDLHTLGEDETIARLANGIKRFKLPDEFNYIKIYQRLADRKGYGETPLTSLAQIFENRRQYDRAAGYWSRSILEYGPGGNDWKRAKIDQILGNWGQFEPVMTHPAGEEASVEFRFRNGKKVSFVAKEIDVSKLLADLKEYLKSNPRELDWRRMDLANIGYRLVENKEKEYVADKPSAEWSMDLEPRPMHFDKRVTVKTPLKKAGAYMLTATMADGNVSKIVIWIDNTVIVRKQLDKKAYFFVADAVTGEPLPKMNVEFFGYRQEQTDWQKIVGRHYNIFTTVFAESTDDNGQIMPSRKDFADNHSWLITATSRDRLAFLGFSGVWYGDYYDQEYQQTKVFSITDRPVYRPKQPVKFKFWVRHAKYDQEDTSSYANNSFTVQLYDPKGEKVMEKSFTADAYGGFDGEYLLPDEATLGVYSLQVLNYGGGTFRVEEYKKPEFEVKIEAPTEPVMLGEKITATMTAKYYFGAPVTKGKVKYKVLRSDYSANWYPVGIWDWFYGAGYWWFAYDYAWYPGWRDWGCRRPHLWWWPVSQTPPEIVAEAEVPVGPDGTLKIDIDTALAKELHGDTDHRYEITAEVTDESRRTIVGQGTVLVARKPFKVYAWVDRGHYRVGDVVRAEFTAQTLDSKPVQGTGELNLIKISYDRQHKPVERIVQEWNLSTDVEGRAHQQIKASEAGQYRLSYKVTDSKKHTIEGAYVFCVMGKGDDGKDYRFNEVELVTDKREYKPGEKVGLRINADRRGSTVLLFVRPTDGIYLEPKVLRLKGKSIEEEIEIMKKDMPNFFIEALTVSGGKVFTETREIIVPPEKRVLNVEVQPSAGTYKPGEQAKVSVKLTDMDGKPFVGSTVMSVYDKSVEYVSGGSNVQEIRAFFWKWRRHHNPATEHSLNRYFVNLALLKAVAMQSIGTFGAMIADEFGDDTDGSPLEANGRRQSKGCRDEGRMERNVYKSMAAPASGYALAEAPMPSAVGSAARDQLEKKESGSGGDESQNAPMVEAVVRSEFADTAFWMASLMTDSNGLAAVEFKMPENLTGWKIKTWAMGHGTKVGEGSVEVVTAKKLMLRLQAPRFFVEKDEVVLSANIHNYLDKAKKVRAVLELDGGCLAVMSSPDKPGSTVREQAARVEPASRGLSADPITIEIPANGEQRVDWRVKVVKEGEAVVRMKALTDEESDAMQMKFPVYVHGMLKTESFSGVIRPDGSKSAITLNVPAERRMDESRLEVRYSPTLAGAMVDALPYLVEYPYGCTEQTLNKFLPTVIVQKILKDMGIDLKDVRDKQTNLNAQEIGDDKKRMEDWNRLAGTHRWDGTDWVPRNPVFDEAEVNTMVRAGVQRLTNMQLTDGGWGWFSGWGEQSWPHTTAYVVHGLQIATQNGVALVPGVLDRGVEWLWNYQAEQVRQLKLWDETKRKGKSASDNLDAFVFMVLVDAGKDNADMCDHLYRDRNDLSVYAKAMFGMALHKTGRKDKLAMIMQNIGQFLVEDKENQTAHLNLGNGGYWWYWYGSEYEAHGYYLKLLALTDPKSEKAAGLVKYLLNNRRHASYWNSTRDTAICIEALADYLRASGEDKPDMTIEVYVDGRKRKEVKVSADNLFSFDNKFVLFGDAVETGKHTVELVRKGKGPVYYNAYLTNFTLEDFITKAGLEIKVNRKYYKLNRVDKSIKVAGSRGQALDEKVEKYERQELANMATLKSGDLVEIELEIESKNDYEYIVFEDMKAAGFEPVEVRSGYNGNDLGAYMELRDERVCLFVRALARGKHSVAYRMRAEIPGRFSALPTKASAMYAPELKANSDEIRLSVED